MKNSYKLSLLKFLLLAIFIASSASLYTSCGSDNKSSNAPEEDVPEEDAPISSSSKTSKESKSSSSSTGKEVTEGAITEATNIDLSEYVPHTTGTVIDERNNQAYNTIKVGIYTWITNNINAKLTNLKSTCYAYNDKLCSKYGRLYMESQAADACPEGFNLPYASDWRFLINKGIELNLTYAGICEKRDTLECRGLDTTITYLTRDDSAFIFSIDEGLTVESTEANGFYSLHCVKTQSIVDEYSDLPKCEEESNFPYIYVIQKDTSYRCSNEEWIAVSSGYNKDCYTDEEGSKYVYNEDVLYTCKNEKWTKASIHDVDVQCTDEKINDEYILNNIRYACTDTGWYKLPYPESDIGLCLKSGLEKVAMTKDGIYYYCDTTGWRRAIKAEVFGYCDSTRAEDVITFNNQQYYCLRGEAWDIYSGSFAEKVGFCTGKNKGDTVISDGLVYGCNGRDWYLANNWNYLGDCDTEHVYDTVSIGRSFYFCNDNYIWQESPNFVFPDSSIHLCYKDLLDSMLTIEDHTYICTTTNKIYNWEKAP